MTRYLDAAGVSTDSVRTRYAAIVYLGSDLVERVDYLYNAFDSLSSNGIQVFVVVPNRRDLPPDRIPHVSILADHGSRLGRLLAADDHTGAYLIFDTKTRWCRAARTRAPLQMLHDELIRVAREIGRATVLARANSANPSVHGSPAAVDSVPWDELIREAVQRRIDVDRLPTRGLRLLRSVGGEAYPGARELVFAKPWNVTADARGRVFVCDGGLERVAVLDSNGAFLRWLADKGQGPGELLRPSRVVAHGDQVLVAESCCKLHQFDTQLRWVRSAYWPAEVLPVAPFDALHGRVLVELLPAPPERTNLLYLFEWSEAGLEPVASFFPYAHPSGKYAQVYNAILSRNALSFRTDGKRFLALCRVGEPYFVVLDLLRKSSWKFVLRGRRIRTRPHKGSSAPPYAHRLVVDDFAFDCRGHLFALTKDYGLMAIDLRTGEAQCIYERNDLPGPDSSLRMYISVAVRGSRVYLVSPYLARLDICALEK